VYRRALRYARACGFITGRMQSQQRPDDTKSFSSCEKLWYADTLNLEKSVTELVEHLGLHAGFTEEEDMQGRLSRPLPFARPRTNEKVRCGVLLSGWLDSTSHPPPFTLYHPPSPHNLLLTCALTWWGTLACKGRFFGRQIL
jgi:hypothetical protein